MRVLFAASPEKSIFRYLVPLAWALRTAGHEVCVAAQPAFAGEVTQAGLTAVPVGRDVDPWRVARMTPGLVEATRAGLPAPYDILMDPAIVADPAGADWQRLRDGQQVAAETARDQNFPIIAALVAYARHWRPDLVIWEPLSFAGAIAAKACGAAHARLLFGVDVHGATRELFRRAWSRRSPSEQADPLADWLTGYAHKYGFDYTEDLITGHFTIDQLPPSLQTHANLHYLPMQHIPYGGPAIIPPWLKKPPHRPRIALTLGLSATEIFGNYTIPLPQILTTLADLDIDIIATIAKPQQTTLGPLPPNIRLTTYVPWHALVPTCTAVIHHAGAATLTTTSRHPIPQLALHYHWDQPILAHKLAQQGAGLQIHTTQATPTNVRHALQRLLTEPTFTHHATQLAHEIHQQPTPQQLIPHLENLTTQHRTTAP